MILQPLRAAVWFLVALCIAEWAAPATAQDAPLLKILDQFTAPDVPASGPAEIGAIPRTWLDPTTNPAAVSPGLPGKGIAQHPMLYAGEGYNTLFLVNNGKVIWTYSSGRGGEIDDIWLMTNGHILYSRLAAHLNMDKVVEYDKDFKEIWSYPIPMPWSAVRLKNGNTLIDDEKERLVREVNPKGETVWEFKQTELPPGIVQRNNQTADRMANGNTIICSSLSGAKGIDRIKTAQVVEVMPDKKVVWALQDWKNLGPATTVQLLDEPGIPENPGDLQR
jgi:hypothetical protein